MTFYALARGLHPRRKPILAGQKSGEQIGVGSTLKEQPPVAHGSRWPEASVSTASTVLRANWDMARVHTNHIPIQERGFGLGSPR
jgi:hypothetical protein